MPPDKITYDLPPAPAPSVLREEGIESGFIGTLQGLKYDYRLDITDRASLEQIASSKSDPGNGYTKTLRCILQLFIVSNRDQTFYFANNNARHFAFNAEERFLPIYEFADEENTKITHLDPFAERFLKKCDLGRTISRHMVLIATNGNAAKHAAFNTAQIQNHPAMDKAHSNFYLN